MFLQGVEIDDGHFSGVPFQAHFNIFDYPAHDHIVKGVEQENAIPVIRNLKIKSIIVVYLEIKAWALG